MADINFTDGGGNSQTLPQWATEATLNRLVEALIGKTEKSTESLTKALNKLTDVRIPELDETLDEFKEELEDVTDVLDDISQSSLNYQTVMAKAGGLFGSAIDKIVGLSLVALGTATTLITTKFDQLGNTFNSLSQSGLALEGSTAMNVAAFNELGMSTEKASRFMLENAQAVRVLGQNATPGLVDAFLQLTNNGIDLGMSLQDTIGMFGDELALRTQLLNIGALDINQRRQMASDIGNLSRQQLAYSKALGISTTVQREFVESVLGNNQMFMASTLRFSDSMNSRVLPEIQSFLSGMRAMGGDAGGELSAAILEAASMGAIGFSDAAFGFITVLPQLSGAMQDVISGFEDGSLNGMTATMAFVNELGNLTEYEKQRVFLLARAGDQNAQVMAKAIKQFEQATQNAQKVGYELENVQKGFNAFNTVIDKIKGTFSSFFNMFMDGFGSAVGDVTNIMSDLTKQINNLLSVLFATLFGVSREGKTVKEVFKEVGQEVGRRFNSAIVYASSYLEAFVEATEGMSFGEIMSNVGDSLGVAIRDLIPWGTIGKYLMLGIGAVTFTAIATGILAGITKAFASKVVTNALAGGTSTVAGTAATAATGGGGAAAGGGIAAGMKAMGPAMKSMAAGFRAFATPQVALGVAVVTLAIMGLAKALSFLAPLVESIGKAIKSVFEGVTKVIEGVGNAIAKVVEAFSGGKVARINAEADAMKSKTQAVTAAVKDLAGAGISYEQMSGLAMGIDELGTSLGVFATEMTPGIIDSLRAGFGNLLGLDSPIQNVINMSERSDPNKIMELAKATMAMNSAMKGATSKLEGSNQNISNNTYSTDSNQYYNEQQLISSQDSSINVLKDQLKVLISGFDNMRTDTKSLDDRVRKIAQKIKASE